MLANKVPIGSALELCIQSRLSTAICYLGSGHPAVAKVAFTGSVATGRRVNMAAAANLRPTTMELGGKSAIIVFEDADIANAVEWVMVRCSCPGLANALQGILRV